MVNDTRSGRKNKDDENNNLKGRQSMGRGSATSGSGALDASGLRRSARETSSKKSKSPSPSNNQKSEQLEKLTLTPPVQRKYDRAEKVMLQSPLRRSERGKNPLSSSSSGSKKSEKNMGSSDKKRKMEKKKKSVKQLTMETKEIRNIEEQDVEPVQMKKRRLHVRAYWALFKQQPRKNEASVHHKEMDRSDSLSQEHSNKCNGCVSKQVDEDNECGEGKEEELREEYERRACERVVEGSNYILNKFEKKQLENHGLVLSHSSPKHSCAEECQGSEDGSRMQVSKIGDIPCMPGMDKEMSNDAEGAQVGCCVVEELQTPQLISYISSGSTLHGDVGLDRGHQVVSKSKSNAADIDFDSAAIVASKDICTSITNSICSSPAGCEKNNFVETCCTSLKRKRVDHDSTKQDLCSHNTKSIQGLCDTSITKDRGLEPDVATGCGEKCNNCMQLKESHVDIQTDGQENTCLICKLGGKLLCCDGLGCRQSYHLSCLEPPLEDVPLGVWHCVGCIQKKIESGVYSVTKGIESIWDAREVKSYVNGSQSQKQFFVKYKGLAHVHNRWVPENQLLREAPLLVANFNQENQVTRWKTEWTVPQRLLQKRLLMSDNQLVEFCKGSAGNILDCHYEWFVKWHGLDYEHASWELENASFLNSPEARSLIAEYKIRRKKAKKSLFSGADKLQISKRNKYAKKCRSLITEYKIRRKKAKKSLFSGADKISKRRSLGKLSRLPAGGPYADHDNYLNFVNKLREYWQWHKGQNAVVIDDLERITKVILFVRSLQLVACRPFLIISDSAALRSWEDGFSKFAPSTNVVVYNGNKDMRKNIRTLEFYEEGGCIMFQVLISPLEFIVEDLEVIECVGWEAVIVDECQSSSISTHFEKIKVLTTDMRLLLVSGQLKESEYLNLLSLLDSHSGVNNDDDLKTSSIDNIGKLKERLSRHIAFDCRSSFSRFVEYWVPVQISNMQLEQYCATLLSNFLSLRSSSKNDHVGALRDILISTRKCCDHPYIVDPLLQTWLTKNVNVVEYLDVGIKASAKLHLLDTMLLEIKNHGLRVLILFQSIGGSGRDSISIGDILDDFLHQRFGSDSYERVEWGLAPSKKQSALNKFNKKECGRFVFLLETRACLPSVKLSSVDTVIIFDSDWNPVNDLRALQRITFDSEFENMRIFRMYSSCTVEEKVLILAKKDMTQDGKLLNIHRTTSQMLLMWGASYLFNKLDELHSGKMPNSSASTMPQHLFLKNVMLEFLAILHQSGKYNDVSDSIILKVELSGATYSTNSSLLGEKEIQLSDEEPPHIFWTKLLEGKRPRWKYSSGSSQRNRKRVNDSSKIPEIEKDEVPKKCKKVVNNSVDPSSPKSGRQENMVSGSKEGASETPCHTLCQSLPRSTACMSDTNLANQDPSSAVLVPNITVNPEVNVAESAEGRKSRDAQRGLHLLLMPEISKLCETLRLSEDVKSMVEQFLEYILNNHHISREPATILQAFQISLCWIAASLLKHKIDHRESLALAKQHLNFSCHEEEVDHVFSKLACLKSIFLYRTGNLMVADSPNASTLLPKDNSHARVSLPTMSYLQEANQEVEDWLSCQECSDKQVSSEEGWALVNKLVQKDISRSIKKIQKKCHKRVAKLIRKQQEEIKELNRICENEKEELERAYMVESLVIHSLLGNNSPRSADRLKIFDGKYTKRFEEHRQQMDLRLKDLEEMHLAAKRKEQQREDQWVEKVKSWAQVELLEKLPSNEPGHGVKYLQTREQTRTHTVDDDVALVSGCLSEGNSFDKILQRMPVDELGPPEIPQTVEAVTLLDRPDGENDQLDILALAGTSVNVFQEQNRVSSSGDIPEQVDTVNPYSEERGPDAASISVPDGDVPLDVPGLISSQNCVENVTSMNLHLSEEGGATLGMPDEQVQVEVPKTSSSSDTPKNVASINLCSSEEWARDGATLNVRDTQFLLGVPEIVSSSIGPENALSINSSSSVEHIPDGATSSICDEEVPSGIALTAAGVLEDGNVGGDGSEVSAKGKSINQQDEAGQNINQNPLFQDQSLGSESPLGGPKAASFSDCSKNAVSANPPSSEEQIPDGTTSSVPGGEVPSGMPDPTAAGVLEVGNINVENVEVYALALDKPNAVEINQRVEAGSINNQDSSFQDPSLGHAPSAPPLTTPAQGGPLPSNQAPEDECSLPSTSIQSRLVDTVPANRSHHEAPVQDTIGQLQVSPSLADSPSSGQNLPSNCGTQHHPSSEGHASFQIARGPMQLVENSQRHPIQNAPPVASRTPLHLYPNPLQHELERLKKETDQTIKIHEDAKLQVKSDCEKEIEEVVAQIRCKYDRKLQEMEAEFTRKKKDLDANHDLVLMNKILAEAFRSKCIDGRSGGAPGMQQDSSSSFRQQPVQMQTAQRPSFITGPSLAPGLQSTTPPAQVAQRLALITSPALAPGMQSTTPPVKVVQHSAFFSGPPARPPHIHSISPPTGNLVQVCSEIRAPAPHLHRSRPSHGMPSGPSATSPALLQRPPGIPPMAYQCSPYTRAHQGEPVGVLSALSNSSLSALDLLMDVDNRAGANSQFSLPPIRELGSVSDTLNVSEFCTRTTEQVTPTNIGGVNPIVCLSDDDD